MSMIEFKPTKITFDAAGFQKEILSYVQKAMDEFEERFIDEMCSEIDMVDTKTYFKQTIQSKLKHIETEIAGGVVTYLTGFDPSSENEFDTIKAKVIAGGMHAGWAGPTGRIVLGNMLDERHPSRVIDAHPLPETWNHSGEPFVENAVRSLRAEYQTLLENIALQIPPNIVSKYIKAS